MRIELSKENLQQLNDGGMVTIYRDGQAIEIYFDGE